MADNKEIERLKAEARRLAGGKMISWETPDLPPEMAEQFWRNVVEFERAAAEQRRDEESNDDDDN